MDRQGDLHLSFPHPAFGFTEEQYIVVGYTDDQTDDFILDRDVVRPLNHKWCLESAAEVLTWQCKSTGRCPTYGSCTLCYRSGLVGKRRLMHNDFTYKVIWYRHHSDKRYILDSKFLAEMIGKGHEIALANRTQAWRAIPTEKLSYPALEAAIKYDYQNMEYGKEEQKWMISEAYFRVVNTYNHIDKPEGYWRHEWHKHN